MRKKRGKTSDTLPPKREYSDGIKQDKKKNNGFKKIYLKNTI